MTTLIAGVEVMREGVKVAVSKTRFSESFRGRQHTAYKIIHLGGKVKDIFDPRSVPALERLEPTSAT